MRLTNRGRVVCGVLATVVVLAGQSGYSALFSRPPAADASDRRTAAASPSPSSAAPVSAPRTPTAQASPAPRDSAPVVVMDRGRDDLPPAGGTSDADQPAPSSASSSRSPSPGESGPFAGTGRLSTLGGTGAPAGKGPLRRYRVQVEGGIAADAASFAAAVQRSLTDKRSWGAQWSFQRVSDGPVAFSVVLASPTLAEQLCKPLEIRYRLSCYSGGRSVINLARWRGGAEAYRGQLAAYRLYVVNHEVGHALGHGHEPCRGAGQLAPVMMQQTKGIGSCLPNPWPYPGG